MTNLIIGSIAPDFKSIDQNGESVQLSDFKGKKVILYFYPKDNTPGCTAEACNLKDNFESLTQKGFVVLGVSADSEKAHKNFADKYSLPFKLIADTDKQVLKLYNAWGEKKMYGKSYEGILRKTFIISETGIIEHIIEKVDTKNHTEQILKELKK